jgi:hypothetical protein
MDNNIVPSNFVRFDSEGLELVVNTDTGLAYATIRGAARMLDRGESTIRSALGARNAVVINARVQTEGGLQGARLIDAETLYDMAFEYNLPLAKKMGAAGANLYMLNLAGYKTAIEQSVPKTFREALLLAARQEEQIEMLKIEKQILAEENEQLSEAVDELFSYSSIVRIAKFNNCCEKNFSWRSLKIASIRLGVEIKSVPCPRFSKKNLYSHDAWRLAYPGVRLPETTTLKIVV